MTFLDLPESWRTRVALALLLVFAALGLYALWDALPDWVPFVVVAIVALLAWPAGVRVLARFVAAAVVAIVVLAGFDVLAGRLGLHPSIAVGLVIAVVVFGLAAYAFLLGLGWERLWTGIAAAVLSAFVILGGPLLVALHKSSGSDSVPERELVASQLDVLIVTDGRSHPDPVDVPLDPSLRGFDVRFSVGFADREGVQWTLAGATDAEAALGAAARGNRLADRASQPALRQGADSILLLLVDGTPPVIESPQALPDVPARAGEIARWQRVVAGFPGTPAFALLQTTREERLEHWRNFASPGDVVSAQALQSLTATDAAIRLAVASPTAQADFALAMQHRPLLLFDEAEPVPRPLSVAVLFEEGRVRLCRDVGITEASCPEDPTPSAAELESGGTHLRLELPGSPELRRIAFREREQASDMPVPVLAEDAPGAVPATAPPPGTGLPGDSGRPPGAGSAIYVHPVSGERDGKRLLYLDYWWYLPDNPSAVGGGALCGAGFVIAGVTCHSHQSDWEGMTVVVDRTGPNPFVTAVHYAQHNSVVRYGWQLLRGRWEGNAQVAPLVSEASGRPLAFIAKGSHATYPIPCDGPCHGVAGSIDETRHRGNLAWIGNDTGACGRFSCLLTLPTHEGGQRPALWNAFAGAWGEAHCFFAYYCDSGKPPESPAQQKRYEHPARYDGFVDRDWRFHNQPGES